MTSAHWSVQEMHFYQFCIRMRDVYFTGSSSTIIKTGFILSNMWEIEIPLLWLLFLFASLISQDTCSSPDVLQDGDLPGIWRKSNPTSFTSSLLCCMCAEEQEQFLPDCLCWALPCLITSAAVWPQSLLFPWLRVLNTQMLCRNLLERWCACAMFSLAASKGSWGRSNTA